MRAEARRNHAGGETTCDEGDGAGDRNIHGGHSRQRSTSRNKQNNSRSSSLVKTNTTNLVQATISNKLPAVPHRGSGIMSPINNQRAKTVNSSLIKNLQTTQNIQNTSTITQKQQLQHSTSSKTSSTQNIQNSAKLTSSQQNVSKTSSSVSSTQQVTKSGNSTNSSHVLTQNTQIAASSQVSRTTSNTPSIPPSSTPQLINSGRGFRTSTENISTLNTASNSVKIKRRNTTILTPKSDRLEKAKSLNVEDLKSEFKMNESTGAHLCLENYKKVSKTCRFLILNLTGFQVCSAC